MLLQLGPAPITNQTAYNQYKSQSQQIWHYQAHTAETQYPNSLFRLLAAAVAAFPPPYLARKSSFTRSRKATGTCLPIDSSATTQYATQSECK